MRGLQRTGTDHRSTGGHPATDGIRLLLERGQPSNRLIKGLEYNWITSQHSLRRIGLSAISSTALTNDTFVKSRSQFSLNGVLNVRGTLPTLLTIALKRPTLWPRKRPLGVRPLGSEAVMKLVVGVDIAVCISNHGLFFSISLSRVLLRPDCTWFMVCQEQANSHPLRCFRVQGLREETRM